MGQKGAKMARQIKASDVAEAVAYLQDAARTLEAFANAYDSDRDRRGDSNLAWLRDRAGAYRATAERLAGDDPEPCDECCGCGACPDDDGPQGEAGAARELAETSDEAVDVSPAELEPVAMTGDSSGRSVDVSEPTPTG